MTGSWYSGESMTIITISYTITTISSESSLWLTVVMCSAVSIIATMMTG